MMCVGFFSDLINALHKGVFDKIHALSADLPEECSFALERNFLQYFMHLRLVALHEFADYYYTRTRRDMIETYIHYKETLQLITYNGGRAVSCPQSPPNLIVQLDP